MGSKVTITVLWLLLLGLSHGIEVNLTGSWKAEFGWQMKCVWSVSNKLKSVSLYEHERQFLLFTPEKQGPNITSDSIPPPYDTRVLVTCNDKGRTGSCYIGLELLIAPMFGDKFKCEVSEEGPTFEVAAAQYVHEVFVPPSHPQLKVSSVERVAVVNCTAAGIPEPKLTWRIGEQKIPEIFTNRTHFMWDFKTKLWHSWSVVSVLRDENPVLSCTATITKPGRRAEEQTTEIHLKSIGNYGRSLIGGKLLLAIFTFVTLLR